MNPNLKLELAMLLEERRLSNFERRKRRLARTPLEVVTSGLLKISRERGEPLTLEEYIGTHLGFFRAGESASKDYASKDCRARRDPNQRRL
jgi:hypothetical protein